MTARQTNRPLTLSALLLSMFMSAMEMTAVSTAMPTIVGELGGIHLYSWVFTAYLLTSTVMVPIFGKLADLYGRKPIVLLGIAIFLVGSVGCGLSTSMLPLVLFRAVQGIGSGAMQPMGPTIVGDIYTLQERARVQGVISGVWGFAGLIGPVMGSLIVEYLSWHWVFFINVPFGLLAIALLVRNLHESVERRVQPLDYLGGALLTGTILLLLSAASGALPIWSLAFAAALLVLFVRAEKRAREPMLPLDLFSDRIIGLASLSGTFLGASMLAIVTYVPLFVEGVLGGSPSDAASVVTPMVVGWPLASLVSGRMVPRVGARPFVVLGMAVSAAAAIALAVFLSADLPLVAIGTITFLFGCGLGFANPALILAVQTAVSWNRRGVATASTMFFRTIGGTLSVGALGGVLAATLAKVPNLPEGAIDDLLGPSHGASISRELLALLEGALARGLHTCFAIVAVLSCVSLLVGLLFPREMPEERRGVAEGA